MLDEASLIVDHIFFNLPRSSTPKTYIIILIYSKKFQFYIIVGDISSSDIFSIPNQTHRPINI